MASLLRRLGREFAAIALVAIIVTVAMVAVAIWLGAWRRPQTIAFNNAPFGLLLSAAIAGCATVLLLATGRIVRRIHPVLRWVVWIATFVGAAVMGTFLAPAILYVAGGLPRDNILAVFRQNILGTIPTTIVVGTFIMTVEVWKQRVQATEAAVQEARIERERAERLASEAQLASLSARLHPHFLFNTLNAIAALVRDDPRRAEQMVEELSTVLRGSLNIAVTVPIEREMKLVNDYLHIQQTRLGAQLRFALSWDRDDLAAATLPPFALQTLVENAIKHVGSVRPEGVTIDVRAARKGDFAVVEVHDDGYGFDAGAPDPGHGLGNVQARLRAIYGGRAGLEFERTPDGMTVRVRVPIPSAP
jgi:hypothetical protein